MEKLTDILARTGKASMRELAAILKIDTIDALKMLRELQDEGAVCRDGSHWCLPVEQVSLPSEPESLPVQQEKLPVEPNIFPGAAVSARKEVTASEPAPAEAIEPEVAAVPLKVVWSAPEDVEEFPTMSWIFAQERQVKNELRWLQSLKAIRRQINRKKVAIAYFRERV